jgi:hypothetical protein
MMVRFELERAALAARAAGVPATITLRAGNAVHELLREVVEVGTAEVFYVPVTAMRRSSMPAP